VTKPSGAEAPGYQRGTRSYRWAFPAEMDVVKVTIPAIATSRIGRSPTGGSMITARPSEPARLISGPAYDAECAYDPQGRYIVYASQKGMDDTTQRPKIGLDLFDTTTNTSSQLTAPEGYNGGPFFSADGTMICMRADRKGDDLLQVYVLKLDRDESGKINGVKAEYPVTQNDHVNWAPFFHPSGEYLIYATSEVGHDNYEVFAVEVPRVANSFKKPELLAKKRVTHASGFDGLPVFSPEGEWMMWTSQRGPKLESEAKPSSQLWVAKIVNTKP
jgi:Tol biopolymer transport system component